MSFGLVLIEQTYVTEVMDSGTTSHDYVLGRDYLASARSDIQDRICKPIFLTSFVA